MEIDANASGTTARMLTLNDTMTDANGTSDMISLLGGGTVNVGLTNSKGTLTRAAAASSNINVANGSSLVFGGNTAITGTGDVLSFTGNSTGKLTLDAANSFSGGFTLTSGTVTAVSTTALGSTAGLLSLNGGTLDLENAASTSVAAYNTVIGGNVTIKSGVASGTAGNANLFGTLSIGADTLTANKGSNVSTGLWRVQFGATTLTGNAVLDAENSTFLVVGAGGGTAGLAGNFNLTVQSADGTGSTSVRSGTVASTRTSGTTTFLSGINNINSARQDTLGSTATTLVLTGGSLDLQTTSGINPYPTTVNGNFTLTDNSTSVTQTLGTLSIGTFTLKTGSTAASGTSNLGFGATTFTGNTTFNVTNGTGALTATSTLTLGALNDGGTARTITKIGASTSS